jgi:hypothetical protein
MLLAKPVNRGETMEGLHDIQHVSGAHRSRLAVVVVIQVLVHELLILETQRYYRFLNVLEKDIISPFHGLDELIGGHDDGTDAHFPSCSGCRATAESSR